MKKIIKDNINEIPIPIIIYSDKYWNYLFKYYYDEL